ncbi:uncharacterized protein [Danio rerio]|uniref:Uncharacterized protein n=1 Tax=Danio rerio TaxID=7955 RepID=A0AC58GXI0_DANRE
MVFMKITTEVVQMNGEEEVNVTMPNEDQKAGTLEEDQTAETESHKSPSKEDKTDDAPQKKKTAMDQGPHVSTLRTHKNFAYARFHAQNRSRLDLLTMN